MLGPRPALRRRGTIVQVELLPVLLVYFPVLLLEALLLLVRLLLLVVLLLLLVEVLLRNVGRGAETCESRSRYIVLGAELAVL